MLVGMVVFVITKPLHPWKSQQTPERSPDVSSVPKNGKDESRSKPGSPVRLHC